MGRFKAEANLPRDAVSDSVLKERKKAYGDAATEFAKPTADPAKSIASGFSTLNSGLSQTTAAELEAEGIRGKDIDEREAILQKTLDQLILRHEQEGGALNFGQLHHRVLALMKTDIQLAWKKAALLSVGLGAIYGVNKTMPKVDKPYEYATWLGASLLDDLVFWLRLVSEELEQKKRTESTSDFIISLGMDLALSESPDGILTNGPEDSLQTRSLIGNIAEKLKGREWLQFNLGYTPINGRKYSALPANLAQGRLRAVALSVSMEKPPKAGHESLRFKAIVIPPGDKSPAVIIDDIPFYPAHSPWVSDTLWNIEASGFWRLRFLPTAVNDKSIVSDNFQVFPADWELTDVKLHIRLASSLSNDKNIWM